MFTATESEVIKRLLQATNAVLASPKDQPVHPEVLVELEHGRTAVATCYADYVDTFAEKLDKAKDNMNAAWQAFSPKTRNSYGPIFDAANVRPEPETVIDGLRRRRKKAGEDAEAAGTVA